MLLYLLMFCLTTIDETICWSDGSSMTVQLSVFQSQKNKTLNILLTLVPSTNKSETIQESDIQQNNFLENK